MQAVTETPDRSFFGIAGVLLRWRRVLIAVPLIFAVVAGALYLLDGASYIASSQFAPHTGQGGASQLSGLAAQFGINVGVGGGEASPDFYATVLESPELLEPLVEATYRFPASGAESADTLVGTLAELYEIEGETVAEVERAMIRRLREDITASADGKTAIVTVSVEAPWAPLAVQLNSRLLELLNEFNVTRRRSRASEERAFVEERLGEAREELREAEAELQRFVSNNRILQAQSPLALELGRLQRKVDLRQQVYLTLAQAYEQARIEEVRETPVITIIERPGALVRRSPGSLPLAVVLGLILGTIVAMGIVFLLDILDRERWRHPEEYARVRSALGWLGRRLPGGIQPRQDVHDEHGLEETGAREIQSGAGARHDREKSAAPVSG